LHRQRRGDLQLLSETKLLDPLANLAISVLLLRLKRAAELRVVEMAPREHQQAKGHATRWAGVPNCRRLHFDEAFS
jgi:hypothetical protein